MRLHFLSVRGLVIFHEFASFELWAHLINFIQFFVQKTQLADIFSAAGLLLDIFKTYCLSNGHRHCLNGEAVDRYCTTAA